MRFSRKNPWSFPGQVGEAMERHYRALGNRTGSVRVVLYCSSLALIRRQEKHVAERGNIYRRRRLSRVSPSWFATLRRRFDSRRVLPSWPRLSSSVSHCLSDRRCVLVPHHVCDEMKFRNSSYFALRVSLSTLPSPGLGARSNTKTRSSAAIYRARV